MIEQDINDPDWMTDVPGVIPPDVERHDTGHKHEGIRTLSGLLDMVHGIEEDILGWIEREQDHGRDHGNAFTKEFLKQAVAPVRVLPKRPNRWRANTYTGLAVTGTHILSGNVDRQRAVIVNWGPGLVYLSHDSGAVASGQNVIQVPISTATFWAPREIQHDADVWAFPSAGQVPTIDVQEEGSGH